MSKQVDPLVAVTLNDPKATIAESALTYRPPQAGSEHEAEDFSSTASASIREIEEEFRAAASKEYAYSDDDGKAASAAGQTGEGTEEDEEGGDGDGLPDTGDDGALSTVGDDSDSDSDLDLDPKIGRSLQRVVQRELAAKDAEARAAAKIAELKALQADLAGLSSLKSTKDLMEMAGIDPIGAIKAIGQDPDEFLKLAVAQQLGDTAPDELKDFAKNSSTRREIAALKRKLAEQDRAKAAQEFFNSVQSGAREHVAKNVGDSTPTLAVIAKADPDRAVREIMEEITRDAQVRAASDPDGEPLAYAEAAARVEARMAQYRQYFAPGPNSTNTATTQSKQKPESKVPPQSKPPTKPIATWQKSDDIMEQGIQEAMREYHRSESARRELRRR